MALRGYTIRCFFNAVIFLHLVAVFSSVCAKYSEHFVISGAHLLLIDPDTHKELPLSYSKAIVTAHNGNLFVNKKKIRLPLIIIKSTAGGLLCNGKRMPSAVLISYMRNGSCSCVPYNVQKSHQKESSCVVKVLLDESSVAETMLSKKAVWEMSAQKLLTVSDGMRKKSGKVLMRPTVQVGIQKGVLYLNGKVCSVKECIIESPDNHISVNGTVYHGHICITFYKSNYLLVNHVPLEDYLFSVLNSESWPGWPLEVNKAFAITSRSYVIAMIMNSKKSGKPYHVKNTNIHQTYRGVHTGKVLKDAVDQTKGVFLGHNDKPITAMFDSCCGSIVPADVQGVDFKKAPYLARTYACVFCKGCKIFNWSAEYDAHDMAYRFSHPHKDIGQVKNIKITKKDKAGLIQEIQISGKKRSVFLSAKELYSYLSGVKSFCFTAQCKSNKVLLKGKGYGHHLGLCQWGAREMVRQGWNYKSILQYYYPGTMFMRLSE